MKKILFTLGSLVLLTSSPLFAVEEGQSNHGVQNTLLAQGNGSGVKHQYRYQKKHMYQGTNGQGQGNMSGKNQGQGNMSGNGEGQGNMSGNGSKAQSVISGKGQGGQSKGSGMQGGSGNKGAGGGSKGGAGNKGGKR